jgi:hypothetical protein
MLVVVDQDLLHCVRDASTDWVKMARQIRIIRLLMMS